MSEPENGAGAGAWVAFGATDVGLVRKRNEDAFAVDDEIGCHLVADGLGGHPGGDVASRIARDAVCAALRRDQAALAAGEAADVLERAVLAAHTAVLQAARGDPSLESMATTVSVLWLGGGGRGAIAHVGDSRVYRLDDAGLTQLTEDHTMAMELVRSGTITLDEARNSVAWDILTRSVGFADGDAVDGFAVDVAGARAFLVCSDGLTGMVDDGEIARLLRAHAPDPEATCAALIDAAVANGGIDNVTVVVVYPRGG